MLTETPNKNTRYVVKNLHGTTGLRCSCGSWLGDFCQMKYRLASLFVHLPCCVNRYIVH